MPKIEGVYGHRISLGYVISHVDEPWAAGQESCWDESLAGTMLRVRRCDLYGSLFHLDLGTYSIIEGQTDVRERLCYLSF